MQKVPLVLFESITLTTLTTLATGTIFEHLVYFMIFFMEDSVNVNLSFYIY